jgi:hypothetical protein
LARFVLDRQLTEMDRRWLATYFERRVGAEMRVTIEQVEQIPLSRRGKHRRVVSTVPLPWHQPGRPIEEHNRGT